MEALFEENPDAMQLLKKYENKELNDSQFLKAFGQINIFYSTPLGDTADGQALFLIKRDDGHLYHPVCVSLENMKKYFEKVGRVGFLIMSSNFVDFLKSTINIYEKAPERVGVIIEPGVFGFTLDAESLEMVIRMIES